MPSGDVLETVVLGFAAIGVLTVLAGSVLLVRKLPWVVPGLAGLGALLAAPRWVHYSLGGVVGLVVAGAAAYFGLSFAGGSRARAMVVIAGLIVVCVALGVSRA